MNKQICPICHSTESRKRLGLYFVCASCRTLFLCPTPREIPQTILEQQAKLHISRNSNPKKLRIHEQRLLTLSRFIRSGSKILDVGCGKGDFLSYAKKVGFDVYGVDKSTNIVSYIQTLGIPASTDLMRLPPKSFDAVTAFDVIEHLSNPRLFIRQIASKLKRGGFIMITTPNALGISGRILGPKWWVFGPSNHFVLFNVNSLKFLLEDEGFVIQDIKTDTFTSWYMSSYVPLMKIMNKCVYLLLSTLRLYLFQHKLGDNIAMTAKLLK